MSQSAILLKHPCPCLQILKLLPEITRSPLTYLVCTSCGKILHHQYPGEMLDIVAVEANQVIQSCLVNALKMCWVFH
jgi:hypothetical protein